MESESDKLERIRRYYLKRESRWGYRLLLGGVRHFGYYEPGKRFITMRNAQKRMERELGRTLGIPPGSLVLDAGCGEGHVALRLAKEFGLRIEGVDLVSDSIQRAEHLSRKKDATSNMCNFSVADFSHLPYQENTFDAVYTMETLVHSPDAVETLKEFNRVLKPHGRLVLFEYSISPVDEVPESDLEEFWEINATAAMYSLPEFTHKALPDIVRSGSFTNVSVEDITFSVVPMLRRFYQIAIVPYQLIRLFGGQQRFVNARSAVAGYAYRHFYRYNIVTGVASKD